MILIDSALLSVLIVHSQIFNGNFGYVMYFFHLLYQKGIMCDCSDLLLEYSSMM